MKRSALALIPAGLLLAAGLLAEQPAGKAVPPPPPAPDRAQAPAPAAVPAPDQARPAPRKHATGLRPAPRREWVRRPRHVARAANLPASFGVIPNHLDYWGNDTYGDCVTAEECFARACYSVQVGLPEVFVPTANAVQWARVHRALNGADLLTIVDAMAIDGIVADDGKLYKGGPSATVNFADYGSLCAAIYDGPVKLGIASSQLDSVVGATNGWVAAGLRADENEDHCVSACGFGSMQALAAMFTPPARLPAGIDPAAPGVLMFTWDTVGIVDYRSLVAITGEALVRSPTTVGEGPGPTPTPDPTPTPTPTPGPFRFALGPGAPAGAAIDPATGVFTWAIPAAQAPGVVTVAVTAANAAGTASATFRVVVTAATAGAPVIGPIPDQAGVAGAPFTLDVAPFVGVGRAAPSKSLPLPMPPVPAANPPASADARAARPAPEREYVGDGRGPIEAAHRLAFAAGLR